MLALILAFMLAVAKEPPAQHQSPYRRSPYVGAIALDGDTGRVLFTDNAARECYPASCTKLMTARLLLKAVAAGRFSLDDEIVQSKRSSAEQPSKIDLAVGETMTIDNALKALMVKSANDVAVMIAEAVAGSVEDFVVMMNDEAAKLGMHDTRFASPNGLPPPRGSGRDFDKSTAEDLSKLALAILRDQPQMLEYTKIASIQLPGRGGEMLNLQNHNNFLWKPKVKINGVDGMKTGYIDAGGSSIVLTAERDGRRAVVVVTGSATAREREENAGRMLNDALDALAW